jgi:cell division transport system ATP-binding protein
MIEFVNVSKKYDHDVVALEDINIKIEKGEFVFLVGPSGSGKSTFLKLMVKEEDATSGTITINDTNINKMKAKDIPF